MKINFKAEAKVWAVFFLVVLISFFVHELGHCTVAWLHGIKAVPTPAKEYILGNKIPEATERYIALGGFVGTVIFTVAGLCMFVAGRWPLKATVLAGAITTPGLYTLLFFLKGSGHDATEFQDAQAALGFAYQGHFIDWFSVFMFAGSAVVWVLMSKPSVQILPRLITGVLLAFIFAAAVQHINNALFDPLFARR